MSPLHPLQRLARLLLLPVSAVSNRLGNVFYLGLALVIGAVAAYAILSGATAGMKNKAYDLIMQSRFQHPPADKDIVIVDIDEAALAAMAPEYGRWPWPRNVMGELVEGIARQKPRAIVFDITFSDPDVFNLDGDRYFRDVIAATPESYFPMIRLPAENDSLSKLKLRDLPGAAPLSTAIPEATLAAVVPYFYAALDGRRLGTINIEADADGIARNYEVFVDRHGWRLYSLAANVAQALGSAPPPRRDILLNWRGRPPTYPKVSFHDVYFDFLERERARPPDEFRGKIVIVGSTAPSLFDLKATPMAKAHPGVEILATAIDNLRRGDYLRELSPWIYVVVTLVSVALLALAFVYHVDPRVVNLTFTFLQAGFLAVSYLTLNFTNVFVDLTAPFTFSLVYFTVARFNHLFTVYRRSGQPLFSTQLDPGNTSRVILLQCRLHIANRRARLALGASIKRQIGFSRYGMVTTPFFRGMPLLYAFFQDSVTLYWLAPADQSEAALRDVVGVLERSLPAIRKAKRRAIKGGPVVTFLLHSFIFTVDAKEAWRAQGEAGMAKLFALADNGNAETESNLVRVITTKEFRDVFKKAGDLTVPAELEKGGLRFECVRAMLALF